MNSPEPRSPSDRLAVVLLMILTLATFARVIANDFVTWDDPRTIARNPWLTPPTSRSLAIAWREPRMDLWVPLTYTTWWLAARVAGTNPHVFHALNLALHAAAVACVFALLRRVRFGTIASAIGAALFAVHPVQVESVAWASGTKDVLSGLLAIAALRMYVASVDEGMRWRPYVIGAVLMLLAMLAKPTAIVVPALAGVIDLLILRRPWKRVGASAGLWLLLALPIVIVAARVQPATLSAEQQVSPWLRPLVATDSLAFYLGKVVWPARLALDYGRSPAAALHAGWLYWTWLIPAVIAAGIVVLARRDRSRMACAGLLLFIVALAPVLGLVRTDFQYYSTVADHYLYLPMLGVALLIAWGMTEAVRRGWTRPAVAVAGVLIAILAVRSAVQTFVWRDTGALFAHVLKVNPSSVAAYTNLAVDAAERDRPGDAVQLASEALKLRPNNVQALTTLGSQQARLGRLDLAEQAYRRAVELAPWDANPLSNLAGLLAQQGKIDQALPMARRAIELDPELAQARANYGAILANTGHDDEALRQFALAVRLDPSDADAGTNYALLLARAGRTREAVDQLRRVLAVRPDHPPARELLGQWAR